MKIATFNINNVNKRIRNLLAWLEGKARRGLPSRAEGDGLGIPVAVIEKAGYGAVWRGQKSWERRRHSGEPTLVPRLSDLASPPRHQ